MDKTGNLQRTVMSLKQAHNEHGLPLELLVEILRHCQSTMTMSPIGSRMYLAILTSICRKWREVALGHSDLWTSFSLSITNAYQLARFNQSPLHGMLKTLRRSKLRSASGTHPWYLYIHIGKDLGRHDAIVPLTSRGSELASPWSLMKDRTDFMKNLRCLKLHAHYRYFFNLREAEAAQRITEPIWPELEYLDLNIIDSASDLPEAARLADEELFRTEPLKPSPEVVFPKLEHLVLRGGCAPWHLPWNKLTTLLLDTRAMHEHTQSLTYMFLAQCEALTRCLLRLNAGAIHHRGDTLRLPERLVTLACLKELTLDIYTDREDSQRMLIDTRAPQYGHMVAPRHDALGILPESFSFPTLQRLRLLANYKYANELPPRRALPRLILTETCLAKLCSVAPQLEVLHTYGFIHSGKLPLDAMFYLPALKLLEMTSCGRRWDAVWASNQGLFRVPDIRRSDLLKMPSTKIRWISPPRWDCVKRYPGPLESLTVKASRATADRQFDVAAFRRILATGPQGGGIDIMLKLAVSCHKDFSEPGMCTGWEHGSGREGVPRVGAVKKEWIDGYTVRVEVPQRGDTTFYTLGDYWAPDSTSEDERI